MIPADATLENAAHTAGDLPVALAEEAAFRRDRTEPAAPCPHASSTSLYGGLLARCDACDLVRTARDPRFVYDESYFVSEQASGYDFDSVYSRTADAERFDAELARLEAAGLRGSVLDVGCATGSFLAMARERGWQPAGVEVAEFARREAERRCGGRVVTSLDELPEGASYGVVALHHVLEHIHEPIAFLRDEVRPRVARRLLVEVPNFASLASRACGAAWQDLRPEQHVSHFTPATLAATVEAAGFRVRAVYTLWAPVWSLRNAITLLRWLPSLRGERPNGEATPRAAATAATAGAVPAAAAHEAAMRGWRPPTGAKKVLTEASRLALAPLVRRLERRGLAERLVLEADPPPARKVG